ncbi:MAG: hypothetical protein ACSLFB_13015 [Acidimicrobiales bacterium]
MHSPITTYPVCVNAQATPQVENLRSRLASEVGEGVISTAIAVLIMALIGLSMWVAFKTVFDDASAKISDNVEQIGS